MLVFGVDVPLIEVIFVLVIVIFIILVEIIIVVILLMQSLRKTKDLGVLLEKLAQILSEVKRGELKEIERLKK